MEEYELLAKTLRRYWSLMRYGKNEVEIINKTDPKQSITVHVPSRLIPHIKQTFNPREPIPKQLDEIFPYVLQIVAATGELDLAASTPKEQKLKIAAAIQCLKDKRQKSLRKEKKE